MGWHRRLSCVPVGQATLVLFLIGIPATAQVAASRAQQKQATLEDSVRTLAEEVRQLNATIVQLQTEISRSRQETREMHQELQGALDKLAAVTNNADATKKSATPFRYAPEPSQQPSVSATGTEPESNGQSSKLEENQQLLKAKVDEQYQTKVESASRYRMKLSGIALLNIFENHGQVDNMDVPNLALGRGPLDTGGSFGATARQSEVGFTVYGPTLANARTSADLRFDLFGGFPDTANGVTSGVARLRTATVRMDWARTSIVVGQEAPFFSPLSPTSIASLAYPAFSYSGNLWTWVPQAWVEHRINVSNSNTVTFEGGFLDPLSGESPQADFYRLPQAGEQSRQPAYGTRVAWTHGPADHALTLGMGGYYSRQNYGAGRMTDAWATTADWDIPLSDRLSLSGEFYRGRALGGLGGGISRSVLFSGPPTDPNSSLAGLNTIGGWTQLKFKLAESIEFNAAYGEDNPFSRDLRRFSAPYAYAYTSISRNQSELFNVIYRPRTDLLFSLEYRHINTLETDSERYTAGHLNLSVGVLF